MNFDPPPPDPQSYQEPKPGKPGIYDYPYLVALLESDVMAARLDAAHWKMLHDKRTRERDDLYRQLSDIKNGEAKVKRVPSEPAP